MTIESEVKGKNITDAIYYIAEKYDLTTIDSLIENPFNTQIDNMILTTAKRVKFSLLIFLGVI